MKRLITICSVCVILFAASDSATAGLWEIQDAGLGDTANFANLNWGSGILNSRSDIAGDPGYQFSITLTGSSWTDISIGDNYPTVLATANGGDLSGYSGYTMTIYNPGTQAFQAALFMNTGYTPGQTNRYYQNDDGSTTWIGAGQTVTLIFDFNDAAIYDSGWTTGVSVLNTNQVTNIGLKIGANPGSVYGEVTSGVPFDVHIVPEPATMLLLGLGGLLLRKRKV
jgi:hypothetical protein